MPAVVQGLPFDAGLFVRFAEQGIERGGNTEQWRIAGVRQQRQ